MLERKRLVKVKESEEIDLGREHVDPKREPMEDIECPRH